jgi:hypothetical protein
MKPIRLTGHARDQLAYRGVTEFEVNDAIRTSEWNPAEMDRLECRKNYAYAKDWNGKLYLTKQVRPIFVDKPDEIVVVTIYSYYF